MKLKKFFMFLLMIIILIGAMYFKGISDRDSTFSSISEAEETIGKIKLPDIGEDYKISTIKYYSDNFTTPVLRVYFQNHENKEIIFMTTSDFLPSFIDFEKVDNENISNMTWVRKHTLDYKGFKGSYILQWRKSNKESYKYLVMKDPKDKEWLTKVAEKY